MASDVPAYLEVGTPVSAKFKGAFCEATIKAIKKLVKCKVVFKVGCGSIVVSSDHIEGDLILNSVVQVKQEDGDHKEGILQKMNDHSLYTVVFDDGDERTLKRTNVCVMGEKHFREHENLDNLPLTDPENFLSPVLLSGDKRRKRNRVRAVSSVEDEDSDSDGTKSGRRMLDYDKEFLGKVVCIELGERKKSWFPALGLKSYGSQPDNSVYVQSFKDGKKMLVQKEDVKEFHKDKEPLASYFKGEVKIEPILRSGIDKALAYNDFGELPKGWNILDTIDEKDDSSDEENSSTPIGPALSPESKAFQDIVFAFMSRQGTSLTKAPIINNQTVDLCKLFEIVQEYGGMDEVSNQQWRAVYTQLGLQNIHSAASFSMKSLYKRYLGAYEEFVKSTIKSPGRQSRQKARQRTSKESYRDKERKEREQREKEKEQEKEDKEDKDDLDRSSIVSESDSEPDRRRSTRSSRSNNNNNTSNHDNNTSIDKLYEGVENKKKRMPGMVDSGGEDSNDKILFQDQDIDMKSETEDIDVVNSPQSSMTSEDNDSRASEAGSSGGVAQIGKYKPGTRIAVRYGSGKNQRLYNAKILEVEKEENGEVVYFIHYNGWNHRYDEWIKDERIHGPSSTAPSKRKNGPPPTPLSKIRKDPPKKFQAKIESDTALHSTLHPNTTTPTTTAATPNTTSSKRSSNSSSSSSTPASTAETPPFVPAAAPTPPAPPAPAPPALPALPAVKPSKSPAHVYEKPASPIKSPVYTPEHITPAPDPVTAPPPPPPPPVPTPPPEQPVTATTITAKPVMHSKQSHHRPKPVNETLFIPDIKPSPVKPRLTRNSMQDTFLLNALEESIGKPNPLAMNLQQDILLKSESNASHRRRSNRQTETFPKSDNATESDISSKDEKESSNDFNTTSTTTKKDEKPRIPPEFETNSSFDNEDKKTFSSLDPKESSKEETVKKWIEDSNKILSTATSSVVKTEEEMLTKKEFSEPVTPQIPSDEKPSLDEKPAKRGRRTKNNKSDDHKRSASANKKKKEESEIICDNVVIKTETSLDQSRVVEQPRNNAMCEKEAVNTTTNNTSSDNSQMLSDFCTIVENAHKLEAKGNSSLRVDHGTATACSSSTSSSAHNTCEEGPASSKEQQRPSASSSPSKDHRKHKRSGSKRKLSQSTNNDDEYYVKTPKKEKRPAPPLEYNVDFMSDLSDALHEKDPVDRIVIMQSRLNAMRKLYCKLRSEVASIDRRRRRKLRKQSEVKPKVSST